MPQDIRASPDGKLFYVADMMADGVHVVDGEAFRQVGFIETGKGTHGLYPSRDGKKLYVANRGSNKIHGTPKGKGSVSVIDFATQKVDANWPIPGGGSPDMGNVSADGKWLWLSGRYDNVVYAFDTTSGAVQDHSGRQGAARAHGVAAARPLFARPHREHALSATTRAGGRSASAAHVGLQRVGHVDAAVGALVVLQHGDQRAADREAGAVQRVHELGLALRVAKARLHAPRLERFAVRARRDLAIRVLRRAATPRGRRSSPRRSRCRRCTAP